MKLDNLSKLCNISTTSINSLEDVNNFEVLNGYKKQLKKWKVSFQKFFDLNKALKLKNKKIVTLPHLGELDGFGRPAYINYNYMFSYNPPLIDIHTSALIYETNISTKLDNKKDYILQLEGVDNAYYLFVNDKFVGFSNISHAVKRFCLNEFLQGGENIIKLIVLKYSSSSYLEDQDKMRFSGIFRPIYFIKRPKNYLKYFNIKTDIKNGSGIIKVQLEKESIVTLSGFSENQEISGKDLTFIIKNPRLWSAETPFLYDLIIKCNGEIICQKVGIRKIEIIGDKFYINGTLVKLKGVNRHTSSLYGHSESLKIMEEDIKLFKRFNINAVRTSHYPADQKFYDLCDKYGIYVISESDLESHGAVMKSGHYDYKNFADVIANPSFKEQIIEREKNNVLVNKNHPCIVMWSFGNESGFCSVVDEVIHQMKKYDNRPWHYESNFKYDKEETYFPSQELDVYSRMYPSVDYISSKAIKLDKPFMMCEYCHAMGTSLGEIKDYMDVMFNNDNFFGAFIWEWTNHYVKEDGIEKYGGDFNEKKHDGTFCIDGLVELDRKLTPQMYELREVYAPVSYEIKDKKIYVKNKYNFIDLSKHHFEISVFVNFKLDDSKVINVETKPGKKALLFDYSNHKYENVYFLIRVFNENNDLISEKTIYPNELNLSFIRKDNNSLLKFEYSSNSLIKAIYFNNHAVLKNMRFVLARPFTSNDFMKKAYLYNDLDIFNIDFVPSYSLNNIVKGIIKSKKQKFYDVEIVYLSNELKIRAKKIGDFLNPLRFGVMFDLPNNYKTISYFGYNGESYVDRHEGNILGYHTISIKDNYRPIVPQSANSHYGTKGLILDDNLLITSNDDFSFNYDCFDFKDYKKHRNEMKNTSKRRLIIDFKEKGVGTEACGPDLQKKYEVFDEGIFFSIKFEGIKNV